MKRRKLNRSLWCSMGLAVFLAVGALTAATGTAFARYQIEEKVDSYVFIRALEQIYLGTMVEKTDPATNTIQRVFDKDTQGSWVKVDGICQLQFAVANGTDPLVDFALQDQNIRVQLLASREFWDGRDDTLPELTLVLPLREGEDAPRTYTAKATPINPKDSKNGESLLGKSFGDGWIFRFEDEFGREVQINLPGGDLNTLELTLTLSGAPEEMVHLLQLQVTGDYTIRK